MGFCLLHKRVLVLDNLLAKTFLGLGRYFEGFQRDFEGPFTLCADANGWCGAQPFRCSKTEIRHGLLPRYSIAHTSLDLCCPAFELFCAGGVTTIAGDLGLARTGLFAKLTAIFLSGWWYTNTG